MNLDQAFEDHFKLAVRLQTGRPLRADRNDLPTAQRLVEELDAIEQNREFAARERLDGFSDAKYAVDALLDSVADASFKGSWARRNTDAHVGHNFYSRLVDAFDKGHAKGHVLDVYVLCTLLGFSGDLSARSQEKVTRAIGEVVKASGSTAFDNFWPAESAVQQDPAVSRAHRLAKLALLATAGTFLFWVLLLWGLRFSFGL